MAPSDVREQQDMPGQNRVRTTTTAPASAGTAASAGGGLVEAVCGLTVIALAIAGLAHALPTILAGIAEIVFGAGLLCADVGVVAYFSRLYRGGRAVSGQIGNGGLGAEAVGGLAGVILGILTLVDLVPLVLSAVAVIVFGACVILGGAARARLVRTANRLGCTDEDMQMIQEAHAAANGGRALIGLAAIVLGIVSVVMVATFPISSLVLSLVGLLCLGAGSVLTGAALGSQALATHNR